MFNSPRDTNFNPNDNTESWKRKWTRYLTWTIFAHPAACTLMAFWIFIAPKLGVAFLSTLTLLCVIPVIESQLLRRNIGPNQLVMWANTIRFRRRWFDVWTSTVKAQDDHTTQGLGLYPILSPFPRFKHNIGYFTVRPPSGKTLEFVAKLADPIAAQYKNITQIEILYNSPTDSKGTLQTIFGHTLNQTKPTTPKNATPIFDAPPTNPPVDDLIDLNQLNQKEPTP